MNLAEQVAADLKEREEEDALLGSLSRDYARAASMATAGDLEARQELASLKQEIAERRRHVAEIERHIDMLLSRPPSDRADRIAQRQRHEEQIASRPRTTREDR
jgi:hypothetical protein